MALVAVLFAAGCGGGGSGGGNGGGSNSTQSSSLATKPARAVLRDASKAVQAASSFHISGQIKGLGGQFVGSKTAGIDFTAVQGKGVTGTLKIGGAEVDVVVIGKNGYLRASSEFWKEIAKQKGGGQAAGFAATLFGDKWIKFPAGNNDFGQLTDATKLGSLFGGLTSNTGRLANKGETTYQGQSVVAIESSKGGTLYVAATGTPYPVALVKTGGKSNGTITFSDWNKSVTLTAPKGALDLSQFGG